MKRAANLSVDAALLDDAKALNLNLSQIMEAGLRRAVAEERAARWRQETVSAVADSNAWVEKNGLPLARYRQF